MWYVWSQSILDLGKDMEKENEDERGGCLPGDMPVIIWRRTCWLPKVSEFETNLQPDSQKLVWSECLRMGSISFFPPRHHHAITTHQQSYLHAPPHPPPPSRPWVVDARPGYPLERVGRRYGAGDAKKHVSRFGCCKRWSSVDLAQGKGWERRRRLREDRGTGPRSHNRHNTIQRGHQNPARGVNAGSEDDPRRALSSTHHSSGVSPLAPTPHSTDDLSRELYLGYGHQNADTSPDCSFSTQATTYATRPQWPEAKPDHDLSTDWLYVQTNQAFQSLVSQRNFSGSEQRLDQSESDSSRSARIKARAAPFLPSGDEKLFSDARNLAIWLLENRSKWKAFADPTFITQPSSFQALSPAFPATPKVEASVFMPKTLD